MNHLHANFEGMTIQMLIKKGTDLLQAHQKENAIGEARQLLMYLLNYDLTKLICNSQQKVAHHIQDSYMYLLAKRTQGIPLQYITKNQAFMGLDFYVDDRVLIPRLDTEVLIETLQKKDKKERFERIIEVGVGSGCISITLAHCLKDTFIWASDISKEALAVAKKNAIANNVNKQITFIESNLFEQYPKEMPLVDLIVSNPPYITAKEYTTLMTEVRNYEPQLALTDRADGLTFYRAITKQSHKYLKPLGILAYEIGYNQAADVKTILEQNGFGEVEIIKDLAGKDRVVLARKEIKENK